MSLIYDICNPEIEFNDAYIDLTKQEEFFRCVKIFLDEDDGEFIEATININTKIYRGDRVKRKYHHKKDQNIAIFLADMESSLIYTRDENGKRNPKLLTTFQVIKNPKLFLLCNSNLKLLKEYVNNHESALFTILNDEEKATINLYYNDGQVADYNGPYIHPTGKLYDSDFLCENKIYLNRRMINIICKIGYDGWISLPSIRINSKYSNDESVKNITLIQKNLDMKYYNHNVQLLSEDIIKDQIKYVHNPYYPELAIRNWGQFLKLL